MHVAYTQVVQVEEEFVINSQGDLSAKPLDKKDEKSILIVALMAEDQTCFPHGEAHASVLAVHHKFVQELARLHG
jgi:hypothetical protein